MLINRSLSVTKRALLRDLTVLVKAEEVIVCRFAEHEIPIGSHAELQGTVLNL